MHEKRTTPLYDDNKRTTRIPSMDLEGYKRSRIMAMFLAGAFLIGTAWLWVNMQRQKAEEAPVLSQIQPTAPVQTTRMPAAISKLPSALPPPAAPTATPTAAPPAAPHPPVTAAVATAPAAAVPLPVTTAAVPLVGKKNLPATPLVLAASEARVQAGKPDPFQRVQNYLPFPRGAGGVGSVASIAAADSGQPPAPPPPVEKILPPPPPPVASGASGLAPPPEPDAGLSLAELPAPPARPSIGNKMKLVGVIGDRAIIAFSDRRMRMENKWPKTITLGRGEQFESVSVVDVTPDSVTIDEDGERSVKSVEPLK